MQWVTRERPVIDRIACPWLIRRFVAADAVFHYVPPERVMAVAAETGATPFDFQRVEPFCHHGDECTFDAIRAHYRLDDPALLRLGLIVRGADTGRPDLTPQSAGLLAISQGMRATIADDHALLAQGMAVYDALYAWCRSQAA